MLEHLMQETDPSPATPGGGSGPGFTIDLSGLADAIWNSLMSRMGDIGTQAWIGIRDHLGEIGTAIWTDLSQWMYSLLRSLLLTVWNATLLPIPHDTTDQFGPVLAIVSDRPG